MMPTKFILLMVAVALTISAVLWVCLSFKEGRHERKASFILLLFVLSIAHFTFYRSWLGMLAAILIPFTGIIVIPSHLNRLGHPQLAKAIYRGALALLVFGSLAFTIFIAYQRSYVFIYAPSCQSLQKPSVLGELIDCSRPSFAPIDEAGNFLRAVKPCLHTGGRVFSERSKHVIEYLNWCETFKGKSINEVAQTFGGKMNSRSSSSVAIETTLSQPFSFGKNPLVISCEVDDKDLVRACHAI